MDIPRCCADSLLFLIGLAAMALSPWYLLAFVLLLIGGLGTAAFSNMQTTLILTETPPATRSRVMGIVTMCIGTGPVGVVMIGILSEQVGPPVASGPSPTSSAPAMRKGPAPRAGARNNRKSRRYGSARRAGKSVSTVSSVRQTIRSGGNIG